MFKCDGCSSIHVVKDRSNSSSYRPDAICHSIGAHIEKTLYGAGDSKIRLAKGSVGFTKIVFHDEEIIVILLSTHLFTQFYHIIVDNKLTRFDTGEVLGCVRHGTPEVQVELLDFKDDADSTFPEIASIPRFLLSRSHQSLAQDSVRSNEVEGPNAEGPNTEKCHVEEPDAQGSDVESGDDVL